MLFLQDSDEEFDYDAAAAVHHHSATPSVVANAASSVNFNQSPRLLPHIPIRGRLTEWLFPRDSETKFDHDAPTSATNAASLLPQLNFNQSPRLLPHIHINGLPKDFTPGKLVETFSQFGEIESARLMGHLQVPNRKFGLVVFKSVQSAMNAVARGHGMIVEGWAIEVYIARPKSATSTSDPDSQIPVPQGHATTGPIDVRSWNAVAQLTAGDMAFAKDALGVDMSTRQHYGISNVVNHPPPTHQGVDEAVDDVPVYASPRIENVVEVDERQTVDIPMLIDDDDSRLPRTAELPSPSWRCGTWLKQVCRALLPQCCRGARMPAGLFFLVLSTLTIVLVVRIFAAA